MTEPSIIDDTPDTAAPVKTPEERLAEKDAHIQTLEARLTELEIATRSAKTIEELTEDLVSKIASKAPVEPPLTQRREDGPKPQKEGTVDLAAEVKKILEAEQSRTRVEANIAQARNKLTEAYGSDFKGSVEKAAASLGVPTKFLNDLAASNPDGFMNVMKQQVPVDGKASIAPPANSQGTEGLQPSVRKNAAYYRELRKTDRNLFLSKRVQSEMNREAVEQGPAFFQ